MEVNTRDPRAFGLIERGYFYGLSATDRLHVNMKARQQIMDKSNGTAEKGYRTRLLIKRLEDVYINELGFLISDSSVIMQSVNSFGLLPRHLVALKFDMNKKLTNPRVLELAKHVRPYLHDSTEILCPLDIPSALIEVDTKGNLSHQEINMRVHELCEYVRHSHLMLLGCTWMLEFVILYFLDGCEVSSEALEFVIARIKIKYERSNLPGVPIGMQAAQAIGEKDTQSSLSSFHSVSKSGRELHEAKNDNYRYYDMTKSIRGSTTILGNQEKLAEMRRVLKYINMYDICSEVEIVDSKYKLYLNNLVQNEISFVEIVEMITKYSPSEILKISISPVNAWSVCVEFETLFTSSRDKHHFDLSFLHVMDIGYINEVDLIDNCLYLSIDSLEVLSLFDTSELEINIPLEACSSYFGMVHVYQWLSTNYKFSGESHLNSLFQIVSAYQTQKSKPIAIAKFKRYETSPLKATAMGSGRYLVDAALSNASQKINDISTCIFMSKQIPVGTGYYKTAYDAMSIAKSQRIKDAKNLNEAILI
jgi:hypothetical protein